MNFLSPFSAEIEALVREAQQRPESPPHQPYFWLKESIFYHDQLFAIGSCRRHGAPYIRGDEPPSGRKMCKNCLQRQEWARAFHPAFKGK